MVRMILLNFVNSCGGVLNENSHYWMNWKLIDCSYVWTHQCAILLPNLLSNLLLPSVISVSIYFHREELFELDTVEIAFWDVVTYHFYRRYDMSQSRWIWEILLLDEGVQSYTRYFGAGLCLLVKLYFTLFYGFCMLVSFSISSFALFLFASSVPCFSG